FGHEAPSQPNAAADRQWRYAVEGPARGQKRRGGFDQHRLDGNAGALGDEGRSSLQSIDRRSRRSRSFLEKQELAAALEVLHRLRRGSDKVVVAYVAGKACRGPVDRIVDQRGLVQAGDGGQAGEDHDWVR